MTFRPLILGMALAIPMSMMAPLAAMAQNAKPLSSGEQQFLNTLAKEDMSEIRLAHLALRRSNNPQVKQYAKTILSADPSMEEQAKQIAKQHQAAVPQRSNAEEQHEFQKLSKLQGKKFDKAYMKYEATQQQADLITVQQEASTAKDQKVKNFAMKEKAPVQQASRKSRQIASAMGIQMPTKTAQTY